MTGIAMFESVWAFATVRITSDTGVPGPSRTVFQFQWRRYTRPARGVPLWLHWAVRWALWTVIVLGELSIFLRLATNYRAYHEMLTTNRRLIVESGSAVKKRSTDFRPTQYGWPSSKSFGDIPALAGFRRLTFRRFSHPPVVPTNPLLRESLP